MQLVALLLRLPIISLNGGVSFSIARCAYLWESRQYVAVFTATGTRIEVAELMKVAESSRYSRRTDVYWYLIFNFALMTKRKPGGFCHSDSLDGTIGKAIGLHNQTFCEAICDEHEQGNSSESFLSLMGLLLILIYYLSISFLLSTTTSK